MTYTQLWHRLTAIYDQDEAKAIARWVLDVRFGLSMTDILCGKDTQLSADHQQELEEIAQRLEKAEPVQYVLGVADFCGRQVHVGPGVLIPRPETAELCQTIIGTVSSMSRPLRILDIGTGSGCIAITLALDIPGSRVMAWDISPQAVETARRNARRLGAQVEVEEFNALGAGGVPCLTPCLERDDRTNLPQWDVIVSNPPYVFYDEREEMTPSVLQHEPHEALFAPDDNPWMLYNSIARYASQTLRPQGMLFLETNPRMAEQLAIDVMAHLGSGTVAACDDTYGRKRFIIAQKD